MSMKFRPAEMPDDARAYLQDIWNAKGRGSNGVFYGRKGIGSWFAAFFGLALIGLAIFLLLAETGDETGGLVGLQITSFTLGCLIAFSALHTLRARRSPEYAGDFSFVDSEYLWEVRTHKITVTPIDDLQRIEAVHHFTNGVYSHTAVTMHLASGKLKRNISPQDTANKVVRFLASAVGLRQSLQGDLKTAIEQSPALLSAMAAEMSQDLRPFDPANVSVGREVPALAPVQYATGSMRLPLQGAVLCASGLLAWLVFPPIYSHIRDERLYANLNPYNLSSINRYLGKFPAGRHAAEARQHKEEFMFTQAKSTRSLNSIEMYLASFPQGKYAAEMTPLRDHVRFEQAKASRAPQQLRNYLADQSNTLHRTEAQAQIDEIYDAAIARLKKLSEGKPVEAELFKGLLALLQGLKNADNNVIIVRFEASHNPEPASDVLKLAEKATHATYEQNFPAIKTMADASKDHSAIISCGQTFDPAQITRRENLIVERLRASVEKAIDVPGLVFQRDGAPVKGAKPVKSPAAELEITYHTAPSGSLYVYTHTSAAGAESVRGLLRGYTIEWTITMRPPGSEERFVHRLTSRPAETLRIDSQPKDPPWAPYAVLMHSAAYDFSGGLISNVGLEPPPAPTSFRFDGTLGSSAPILGSSAPRAPVFPPVPGRKPRPK